MKVLISILKKNCKVRDDIKIAVIPCHTVINVALASERLELEQRRELLQPLPWNGCVTDRDQDYDTTNTAPSASIQATLFPAEQFSACPEELMPLSYDWTELNKKIDKMKPDGNTNQTIGLQWAFQSLTSAPFTIPTKDPNYSYDQVIILLTDGLNTQNRFSTTQSEIDARTKKACDNINAANITLYTIHVNTGGDPASTMLKNCAGTAPSPNVQRKYPDPDKSFIVTSSSGLGTVFSQIGTSLSKLRISN